jgi:sec-independent protein translocase protein TatC
VFAAIAMPEPREDNLFRQSTMTFGEHLEELRDCLLKSIYGLGLGFIIGLVVGGYVVSFIQQPLNRALSTYYRGESQDRVNAEMRRLSRSGEQIPWTEEEIAHRVKQQDLLADEVFIDPAELLAEIRAAYPGELKTSQVPMPGRSPQPGETPKAGSPAGAARPEAKSSGGDQAASGPALGPDPLGGRDEKLIHLFLWHRAADDPHLGTRSLGVTEGFMVWVKASLLVGVLLASPWIFYQIWHFVAAGLYPHERRYVQTFLPFSIGLFLFGAALAFFVAFEPVLTFLLMFNRSMGIHPEPRINEYLGFVLILPVGFGLGFQLPLVMLFLERIGVCTVATYLAHWRIGVLAIVVVAGVLMPPDITSMILLAGSLVVLYFGGILLCKFLPRRTTPFPTEPER